VLVYAVLRPDKTPLPAPCLSMAEAQQAIADLEPDPVKQGEYQIHPLNLANPDEAEQLKIKVIERVEIAMFDGERQGQEPVQVVTRG
jgi:hypothetical protein